MKLSNILLVIVIFLPDAVVAQMPELSTTGPTGSNTNPMVYKPVEYVLPPSPVFNFKRTWIPQKPETNSSAINEATDPLLVIQNTSYSDGAGNEIQSIGRFGASKSHHSISFSDPRGSVEKKQYSYLPYSVNQSSGTGFRTNPFQEQENFYSTLYPAEGNTAYSETEVVTNVNGSRIAHTYQPGLSMVGQKRGTSTETKIYDGLPTIYKLDYNNGAPDWSSQTYAAGELIVEKSMGQHDELVIKYSDKAGRTIASQRLADVGSQSYETTYYLYDELDRLVFTISPKATEKLENSNWTFTPSIISNLCNSVIYDELGREVESHTGGKDGNSFVVYDKFNRPVLAQNPNLLQSQEWMFTIYDEIGRVCMTGILTDAHNRAYWQYVLDQTGINPGGLPSTSDLVNPALIYTYLINGFNNVSSGNSYPTSIQDAVIMSYYYYDHYGHSDLSPFTFNPNFINDVDQDLYFNTYGILPTLRNMPTRGLLTGMKERIVKAGNSLSLYGDWTVSVNYYDNKGAVIQTQSIVDKQLVGSQTAHYFKSVSTIISDFKGRVLQQITSHNEVTTQIISGTSSTVDIPTKIIDKMIYEPKTFKLVSTKQKINNQGWMPIISISYDAKTGRVLNKNLGTVENQALTYNIRGQLTGINAPYAEYETPLSNVTFGESIKYDYGFTDKRYDGTIAGIIWKTPSTRRRAYGYQYSQAGQLKIAEFNEIPEAANANVISNWHRLDMDLSLNEVQYDLNGNIRNLKRQGPTDVPNVFEVDDLEYTYADNDESNRLERVEDLITYTPQTGSVVQDFQNGNSGSTDYIYDPNGNIISDANKNVSNIQYTFFGKPQRIEFGDGAYLDFIYTASGRKIEERKDLLLGNTTTRDFMGALVYENGILNLIHHPEGHSRLSSNPSGDAFVYDYFVKDHLGNVRTTVTAEEYSMQDYLATHEIAFASIEHLVFDNIEEVRAERPGSTPSNEDAAELDASNAQSRIGTSLLLRVMPGDKFGLSAQAYVDGEGTGRTGTVSAADMLTSIANTLINGSGNGENPENGHSATLVNSLFNQSNYSMTYQTILNQNTNNTHPRSYINYIVFDINMRVVPSQSGAIQVNGVDNVWHVLETFNDIEIEQAGYLAVYISNESMEKMVFFDNINIKYYKGKLLEENHYYPFGMALTIAKDANYDQKELYQTKELFRDKNLNIYDFEARQYDAILGRFMSNDPMNQYASGYVGMGNNPVSNVDPTGMLAWGADQTKISLIAGLHTQDVMWNMMLANDRASLSKSAAELRFNADLFLSDIQGVGDEYIRQAESRIDQWRANNAQKQHHNDVKTSALNAAKSKNVTLPEGLSTADYEGFLEAAFSEKGAIIVGADGVVEDWGEVVGQYFSLDDRITKAEYESMTPIQKLSLVKDKVIELINKGKTSKNEDGKRCEVNGYLFFDEESGVFSFYAPPHSKNGYGYCNTKLNKEGGEVDIITWYASLGWKTLFNFHTHPYDSFEQAENTWHGRGFSPKDVNYSYDFGIDVFMYDYMYEDFYYGRFTQRVLEAELNKGYNTIPIFSYDEFIK